MPRRTTSLALAAAVAIQAAVAVVTVASRPAEGLQSAAATTPVRLSTSRSLAAALPRVGADALSATTPTAPATATTRTAAAAPASTGLSASALTSAQQREANLLRQRIGSALGVSTAARRAVHVYVGGVGDLADVNGGIGMPPASTNKLYWSLAALLRDPQRRLVTTVRAANAPVGGILTGPLYLVGGSDPSLRTSDLAALASAVRASGIRIVQGGLRVDVSSQSNTRRLPGWKSDFVPDELGPLSGLVVDRNGFRTDRGYLADPVPANLAKFRTALTNAGVRVYGTSWYGAATNAGVVIASHASAPMTSLVAHTLKESDNMYAEQLLADLGTKIGVGSATTGIGVIRQYGHVLRVATGSMVDGSGLSAYDSETAAGQVQWLRAAGTTPVATQYRLSLPVACQSGTLRTRLCGTAAAGRVWAKTGTLDGVRALAGYARTRSGRWAVFSVLLAGARDGNAARAAADRVALAVEAFAG